MKARHAARELALITLFQLDAQDSKGIQGIEQMPRPQNLEDMVLSSVRTLVETSKTQLEGAVQDIRAFVESIQDMELDHPINQASPVDAALKPVPLPHTRALAERLDDVLQSAEYVWEAMRLPELLTFAKSEETKDFAVQLVTLTLTHLAWIDEQLSAATTEEWRVDRLVKMDKNILRMALAEMRFVQDVDMGVTIDEAVELAKRYGADESYKFINGVLGKLASITEKQTVSPAG